MAACGDDETDPPVAPPTPIPAVDVFMERYDFMEDITGQMTLLKVGVISDLINADSGSVTTASAPNSNLYYREATGWWVFTIDHLLTDWGVDFFVYDSIQFRYGDRAVQYPELDSLTEISSYGWFVPTDSDKVVGYVHQHLDFALDYPETNLTSTTGEGDFNLDFFDAHSDLLGVTGCYEILNIWLPSIEIVFFNDVFENPLEAACPVSGLYELEGRVTLLHGNDTLHNDSWTVFKRFFNDSVAYEVHKGQDTAIWEFFDSCEVPTGVSW
jgi:hypothetical protein